MINLAQHVGVFASKARTATHSSPDFRNDNATGLIVFIDATNIVNTPSVTFSIEGKDPASGKYYTLLTSQAVASATTKVLRLHPSLTAANDVAKESLPAVWRITATHSDTDSITYSVGASMI